MDLGFKKVYRRFKGSETSGKPGHHMICDVNGNGLKWSDVNDGTRVKLRTKRPHFEGYEYLYTSEIGKYSNLPKERRGIIFSKYE